MKTNTLDFDAQALREKILDLAMRGKLVPQDPNDEPASVLLKKIKAEKEQLIKEKKIKKSKPLAPITDDEKPFDIPDSWEWVRLGDVGEIISGGTPKTSEKSYWENGNIPWITPAIMSDTQDDLIFNNKQIKFINKLGLEKSSAHLILKNSLVVSSRAPIGYVNIVPFDYTTNQGCKSVSLYSNTAKEFVYFALKNAVPDMIKRASGTTFKEISGTKFGQTIIPLPPLEEQSRIAAKIAQLFALLRKVESSTQQYAKLQTLLKSKVLDLAMRGKLVEQDPHDEPASVLLKKIKAEKEQLIKEGKMKKSKPLPPITDDEKPFDIPNSWEWVRLGDVITILRGGSPRPIKKYLTNNSSGINWIKIGDSKPNSKYIESATEKIIPEGLNKTREVHKGDFLLSNSMSFGRPYILKINGAVLDGWLVLSEYEQLFDKDYLYYLLSSSFINKQFVALATGSTVKNLNRERVANTIAVVPPLLEQKRIAVIIERLSPLLSGVEISL